MPMHTALNEMHHALGARMVNFAGWEMPLYYTRMREEHLSVRSAAGMFDIGHMGQLWFRGPGSGPLLDRLLTCSCARLDVGRSAYGFLCNERGGVVDDLIAYRLGPDEWLLIVNAANRPTDLDWITKHRRSGDVAPEDQTLDSFAAAVQGPAAREIVETILPETSELKPRRAMQAGFENRSLVVARTGYTGEEGVEVFGPSSSASAFWSQCLEAGADRGLVPAGLGARDTLRLEMGYPLHGHELSPEITPVEAGLERFVAFDKETFPGRDVLERQRTEGTARRLSGLRMAGRGPLPRPGCEIRCADRGIGSLTSGTLSPSLAIGIGLGYVEAESAAPGAAVEVSVRGRRLPAALVETPIYRRSR